MFAGSMIGPRMKTPLLLLLLLLATLTGTGICQDDDGADPQTETEDEAVVADVDSELTLEPSDSDATAAPDYTLPGDIQNTDEEDHGSGVTVPGNDTFELSLDGNDTVSISDLDTDGLGFITILIPVVLVVMIIGMIVCGIFINRRWNQKGRNQELKKEDLYLDGSSTEKVPMPMFEEDVASVLELEMEEFEQWMKKDVEPAENSIHA